MRRGAAKGRLDRGGVRLRWRARSCCCVARDFANVEASVHSRCRPSFGARAGSRMHALEWILPPAAWNRSSMLLNWQDCTRRCCLLPSAAVLRGTGPAARTDRLQRRVAGRQTVAEEFFSCCSAQRLPWPPAPRHAPRPRPASPWHRGKCTSRSFHWNFRRNGPWRWLPR